MLRFIWIRNFKEIYLDRKWLDLWLHPKMKTILAWNILITHLTPHQKCMFTPAFTNNLSIYYLPLLSVICSLTKIYCCFNSLVREKFPVTKQWQYFDKLDLNFEVDLMVFVCFVKACNHFPCWDLTWFSLINF